MTTSSVTNNYYGGGPAFAAYPDPGGAYAIGGFPQQYGGAPPYGGYFQGPPPTSPWSQPPLFGGGANGQPTGSYPPPPLNDTTALARFQGVAGEVDKGASGAADGKVSVEDLKKAMEDTSGKYSKEDKEAIKYLLDNQNGLRGRLDQFDSAGDGSFNVDTVNKVVANPNAQPDLPLDKKMSNSDAFRTLKDYMDSKFMGKMDREELSRLKDDPNASPEVKAAAKKILENETLFKLADTGGDDDDYDGVIGTKDLDRALNTSNLDTVTGTTPPPSGSSPVVQGGGYSLYPTNTGNPNMDYYGSLYNNILGPANATYQQAMGYRPPGT